MPVYLVRNLSYQYANQATLANNGITFEIEQGEVFALLGPNGAGKTTLVKQLVGLLRPASGCIRLLDQPLDHAPDYTARHISYMPQSDEALNHLQVDEILYFIAHLRGYSRHDAQRERIGSSNCSTWATYDSAQR
jgi:ABC-type multidrug transport system ATPase subunit